MALKSPYRTKTPKLTPRGPLTRSSLGSTPKSKPATLASKLSRYGIKITPGGPGRGPVATGGARNTGAGVSPAAQATAYAAAEARGPYTPAASGGGGGGGFGSASVSASIRPLHEVKWQETSFNLQNANAPSWWKPLIPKNSKDAERPDVQFLMMLNTMIPYMSPEDQRNAAAQIYSTAADAFSYYKPDKINVETPVSEQTAKLSQQTGLSTINTPYFQSKARATGAIDALSQMREKTVKGNRWKLGPSYTWLQQVLGTAEAYGGEGGAGQTRSQYLAAQGALDPLLAQAGTAEIGPSGMIGKLLAAPFFSQAALRPTTQGPGGRVFFGQPSGLLSF